MAAPLPPLTLHEGVVAESIDAPKVAKEWLSKLEDRIQAQEDVSDLFVEESWWRDIIALSWDWTSKRGPAAIGKYLKATSKSGFGQLRVIDDGALQPAFVDMGAVKWLQSGFTFTTISGSGRGLLRLANVGLEEWRAWIVLSELDQLKGQETLGSPFEAKTESNIGTTEGANGHSKDSDGSPTTLIVGAGQSGLAIAARLQHMGINYLVVDSESRVGNSWRARYEHIALHTPKYTDHYPFLKFPEDWQTWLKRDKIAEWQEHYAHTLNLNIMLESTVSSVEYDDATRKYTVKVRTPDGEKTFYPHHFVMAAGMVSSTPVRPQYTGEDRFKGEVYHSIKHTSARKVPNVENKKVVLVGIGTSSHDIAEDFVEAGCKDVSIVQRHPIFSNSRESYEKLIYNMWNTPGMSTEDADLIGNSFPFAVLRSLNAGQTQMMSANDAKLHEGLKKAGMILKDGSDGVGVVDNQFIKGGHFYIDQGATPMIIDGRIKILNCEGGVESFYEHGVKLADGREAEADIVVLCTGFERNIVTVKQIMGEDIAKEVDDIGFLDHEQERIGWWRPTGFPGFWYMTGSFMWTRQYSQILALQIAAIEQGVNKDHYDTLKDVSRKRFL